MRRAAAGSTNIGVELDSSAAVSGRWEEREKKREGGGGNKAKRNCCKPKRKLRKGVVGIAAASCSYQRYAMSSFQTHFPKEGFISYVAR